MHFKKMTRPYNHFENLKKTWFLTEKSVWAKKKVFTQKKVKKDMILGAKWKNMVKFQERHKVEQNKFYLQETDLVLRKFRLNLWNVLEGVFLCERAECHITPWGVMWPSSRSAPKNLSLSLYGL